MLALFFGYLLLISIGVGTEQVHKARKECGQKQTVQVQKIERVAGPDGNVVVIPAEATVR